MKSSRSTLFALAAALLLAMPVSAQSQSSGALPNLSTPVAAAAQTEATTNTPAAAPTTPPTGVYVQSSTLVITGGGTDPTESGAIPTITGGADETTAALLTGLPTLSGAFVIVAPSVPPTANAPYMQVSNLPEGTVS